MVTFYVVDVTKKYEINPERSGQLKNNKQVHLKTNTMKKLILLLIALIPALTLISQAPMEFSYQAILRDASGDPLT
ncbi:MAG: hypothetical protein JNM00_04210, partial [Flavobacteriales bacterium]|nr:hypothetical protein [Flavobacteriales bacterium]